MTPSIRRVLLVVLGLSAIYVGGWAVVAPQNWFAEFPGFGQHWLPVLGPYDEHLARDVGGLYVAMFVLSIGAALRPGDGFVVRLAGICWLAMSIPHTIYHMVHLDMYDEGAAVANVVGLFGVLVLAALLLLPLRRGRAIGSRRS